MDGLAAQIRVLGRFVSDRVERLGIGVHDDGRVPYAVAHSGPGTVNSISRLESRDFSRFTGYVRPSTTTVTSDFDAFLFDIDGTICEYERTTSDMLPIAFDQAGVDPFFGPSEYEARYDEFTEETEDVQELRERCFAAIARDRGRDPELGRAVAKAYAAERDHTNVTLLEGARETLDRLASSAPLGAVTNGSPTMQTPKLDALDLDCFRTIVHAGYETPAKPDPEPFKVALDALDADPEHTLYVGNRVETDVIGAHNAGLPVAWLADGSQGTPEPSPSPDYVIDSPIEILDLIG